MPLKSLWIFGSGVTNLKPLQGMQLEQIRLTPHTITEGLDILRTMKSLKTIGVHWAAWPAAEFWARYDKGEFTKAAMADRRAAEYVLSIGGRVHIDVNGKDRDVSAVANLPQGAFRLTNVWLHDNKQVTDAGLAVFADCTNATNLNLAYTQVTDAGLAHFKDCKGMTELFLEKVKVTDAGLAVFKDCNLTNLRLHNTQVTDAGLASLKDCKNLTTLYLYSTRVTDAGLAHLKDCKRLTVLNLRLTRVTDAGLAYLKDCKDLTDLDLSGNSITDAGLAHLKDWKELTLLNLERTKVSDAGLVHVKDCTNLKSLNVRSTKVSAAGIEMLQKALPKCKIECDGGVIEPTKEPRTK
jgi:Leucine-rich repeat (LRR) protein